MPGYESFSNSESSGSCESSGNGQMSDSGEGLGNGESFSRESYSGQDFGTTKAIVAREDDSM